MSSMSCLSFLNVRSNNMVFLFILAGGLPFLFTGNQCSNTSVALYSYMTIPYFFGILNIVYHITLAYTGTLLEATVVFLLQHCVCHNDLCGKSYDYYPNCSDQYKKTFFS